MKKLFILLVSVAVMTGCVPKNEDREDSNHFLFKNATLLKFINEYEIKILPEVASRYILVIDYFQEEDISVFILSNNRNLFEMLNRPPLMFVKVGNRDVIVRSEMGYFICVEDALLEQKMQEYFPESFQEFKETGEVPIGSTYNSERWRLKFKGDVFISKEILR